jgi:hypothetical protein
VELLAATLQIMGAAALIIGVVLALPLAWALLAVGGLAVAGGMVLEIGHRPRKVIAPSPAVARAGLLDDYRRTASER